MEHNAQILLRKYHDPLTNVDLFLWILGITKQPETEWQFLLLTAHFVLGVMLFSQVLANTMHTVLNSTHETRKFRKI